MPQLFYATFDPSLGPTVLHQVPERLISSSSSEDRDAGGGAGRHSRASSQSPGGRSASRVRRGSSTGPSRNRGVSRDRSSVYKAPTLLDFSPISEYVIPKKALHGKLVTFVTTGAWDEGYNSDSSDSGDSDDGDERAQYKVIGLPSVIDDGEGGRYQRNQYMWNLCFVFRASASLEAFEPVVRKTARILRSAELDSRYLSAPSPDHTPLNALLEQLFEDLNSYSETSIPLDGFNSLEIKLFPFYPNPAEVHDWDVPIPLVNFDAVKDRNWDITAARVSKYIDGINHSAKLAQLADADLALTRETLKHMLFYQVIMMVDIFQYSNMYMVNSHFPRLCMDETVISECGAYVTRPGFPIPDWPALAQLYSGLQPGRTVHQWAEANQLHSRGIDPRRFVSFGIIKGFLRRVHRWPIIVDRTAPLLIASGLGPAGVGMNTYMHPATTTATSALGSATGTAPPDPTRRRVGFQHGQKPERQDRDKNDKSDHHKPDGRDRDGRRSHNRERNGDSDMNVHAGDSTFTLRSAGSSTSVQLGESPGTGGPSGDRSPPRRPRSVGAGREMSGLGRSLTSASAADTHPSVSSRRTGTLRSGTLALMTNRANEKRMFELEDELLGYLDGHHHTDEIQVRLGMGWAQLEKVLGLDELKAGVGRKGVAVVYR